MFIKIGTCGRWPARTVQSGVTELGCKQNVKSPVKMELRTVDTSIPIAAQYALCENSFYKLLQDLESSKGRAVGQRILDEFRRFRVWAGNAVAHQTGRVSLDYRLRETPHIHGELSELLGELSRDLSDGGFQISHSKVVLLSA